MSNPKHDAVIRYVLEKGIYTVNDDGEIYSMRVGMKARSVPRLVKQSLMSDGYCRVGLCIAGDVVYVKAHRVVAFAKVPNLLKLPIVNHKDSKRSHNHPSNLEWVTAVGNAQHALKAGRYKHKSGEKNPASKLSDEEVKIIRHEYSLGGISQSALGLKYGVKQNTVSLIVTRRIRPEIPQLAA